MLVSPRLSDLGGVRVALGPTEIAGVASGLADGLRAHGADVDVVLWPGSVAFTRDVRPVARWGRIRYGLSAPRRRDVFHYQYGTTWMPWFVDAWWARLWRRTLVATYHGDDCRLYGVARELFPARGRAGHPGVDPPRRRRVRRLGRICHAALVADLELATYVRPYFDRVYVTPLPLHADVAVEEPARGRGPPVVIHAATDPVIKGTDVIARAADTVSRRVELEFHVLTGEPPERVAQWLRRADIVIDQLNSVTSGVFALEAMRLGLPVLGEYDPAALAPYQADLPVVRVTPETLESELEALVRDAELRAAVGAAGPPYVARNHGPVRVAGTVLQIYEHARRSSPGLFEATDEQIRPLRIGH